MSLLLDICSLVKSQEYKMFIKCYKPSGKLACNLGISHNLVNYTKDYLLVRDFDYHYTHINYIPGQLHKNLKI